MDRSAWLDAFLTNLEKTGAQGRAARQALRDRRIRVGFLDQPTGARWTLGRHIQLNPDFAGGSPSAPYPLSLVVHELRHLEQGIFTALSVYGELDAWQIQFAFLNSIIPRRRRMSDKDRIIAELMTLSLGTNRDALLRGRELMQLYAGKTYRIDLLPLYPLPNEIAFQIFRKVPRRIGRS